MTDEKFVDTKQYCNYLTNPPKAREGIRYKNWHVLTFYKCAVTGESCSALNVENRTYDYDIFDYSFPVINKEALKKCHFRNLSIDLVKQIAISQIDAERESKIADLEKRLENSK